MIGKQEVFGFGLAVCKGIVEAHGDKTCIVE
jgi:hypothetical protein